MKSNNTSKPNHVAPSLWTKGNFGKFLNTPKEGKERITRALGISSGDQDIGTIGRMRPRRKFRISESEDYRSQISMSQCILRSVEGLFTPNLLCNLPPLCCLLVYFEVFRNHQEGAAQRDSKPSPLQETQQPQDIKLLRE